MDKLRLTLKKGYDFTGNRMLENSQFISLLSGMLEFDPERRMTPEEILESDFICTHA